MSSSNVQETWLINEDRRPSITESEETWCVHAFVDRSTMYEGRGEVYSRHHSVTSIAFTRTAAGWRLLKTFFSLSRIAAFLLMLETFLPPHKSHSNLLFIAIAYLRHPPTHAPPNPHSTPHQQTRVVMRRLLTEAIAMAALL